MYVAWNVLLQLQYASESVFMAKATLVCFKYTHNFQTLCIYHAMRVHCTVHNTIIPQTESKSIRYSGFTLSVCGSVCGNRYSGTSILTTIKIL